MAMDPYDAPPPGFVPLPEPPRSRKYLPHSAAGLLTVSAVAAWVPTAVNAYMTHQFHRADSADDLVTWIFVGWLLVIVAFLISAVAVAVAVGTAIAAIPFVTGWLTEPDRPLWPVVAVVHAVVAWTFLGFTLHGVLG